MQNDTSPKNIEELINAVEIAFTVFDLRKIGKNFLSLKSVIECTLWDLGGNLFKLPHTKKSQMNSQLLLVYD